MYDYYGDMRYFENQLIKEGITREEFDICDYAGCTRRELQSLVDSVIARKKMKIAATAVN